MVDEQQLTECELRSAQPPNDNQPEEPEGLSDQYLYVGALE